MNTLVDSFLHYQKKCGTERVKAASKETLITFVNSHLENKDRQFMQREEL